MIEAEQRRRKALVVVLGDLSASPRTCRHAEALVQHGYDVELLGYEPATARGLAPSTATGLAENPHIRLRILSSPPGAGRAGGSAHLLFQGLWRGVVQLLELLAALARSTPADLLLVQVPPALPTLAAAVLVGRVRRIRVVADWHNFGWSLVALRAGEHGAITRLARWYERRVAAFVDAHLCVSQAMQRVLTDEWRLQSVAVLHDRPAEAFARARERSAGPSARTARLDHIAGPEAPATSKLVVTSTSWTLDEDMTMALEALVRLDAVLCSRAPVEERAPALELVVTGRGQARRAWEQRVRAARLQRVVVRTGWLELSEYAALLASADLGLCLHRSSSGVDLPMKIVDMHGAGLPVAALDYGPCLRELLVAGEEALTFRTSAELASVLAGLLAASEGVVAPGQAARAELRSMHGESWLEGWRREALPLLEGTR